MNTLAPKAGSSIAVFGCGAVKNLPKNLLRLCGSCWGQNMNRYPSESIGMTIVSTSVGDPDPQDPHVFGPPGSGSFSFILYKPMHC